MVGHSLVSLNCQFLLSFKKSCSAAAVQYLRPVDLGLNILDLFCSYHLLSSLS